MAMPINRQQPMDADNWPPAEPKKGKASAELSSEPPATGVVLNPADCDLDFNVEGDGLRGWALYEEGFAYCWSGARANAGVYGGKFCFGCKIVAAQQVNMDDTPPDQKNLCRVGISRGDDNVGNLGETPCSFGFEGTGQFYNAGEFSDYGWRFDPGDTIVCCVDLESKPMASIGFSKNGNWLGIAKEFDAGPCGLRVVDCPSQRPICDSAVFPHILLKNVVVQMQFSVEDGLVPQEGYKPWVSAFQDGKGILGPTYLNVSDREVIMMVGLPASGKSTWAENLVKTHPEKRYILLGTNLVLDQMKVPGLLRKNKNDGQFDCLMDTTTKIFNTLLARASRVPRNLIIDQTNVYKNVRSANLSLSQTTIKQVAVVVFPKLEELKNRVDNKFKEVGKKVPAETVKEMLDNYAFPMTKDMSCTDEYFDEEFFIELSKEESERYLDLMKKDPTPIKEVYLTSGSVFVHSHGSALSKTSFEATVPASGVPPQNYLRSAHEISHASFELVNAQSNRVSSGAVPGGCFPSYPDIHLRNPRYFESCAGYPHYGRNSAENRVAESGDMNELSQSHGAAGYTCSAPNYSDVPMAEPYASTPTFPYNSQNLYVNRPHGPPAEQFIATPIFGSNIAESYGPPHGTPMPGLRMELQR